MCSQYYIQFVHYSVGGIEIGSYMDATAENKVSLSSYGSRYEVTNPTNNEL